MAIIYLKGWKEWKEYSELLKSSIAFLIAFWQSVCDLIKEDVNVMNNTVSIDVFILCV